MEMKLRKEIFNKLLDGSKKSTSRFGERNVHTGDKLVFEMTENPETKYETVVSDVFCTTFSEITEEEAILEGYDSLASLKNALVKIYNPKDSDIFTIIRFV